MQDFAVLPVRMQVSYDKVLRAGYPQMRVRWWSQVRRPRQPQTAGGACCRATPPPKSASLSRLQQTRCGKVHSLHSRCKSHYHWCTSPSAGRPSWTVLEHTLSCVLCVACKGYSGTELHPAAGRSDSAAAGGPSDCTQHQRAHRRPQLCRCAWPVLASCSAQQALCRLVLHAYAASFQLPAEHVCCYALHSFVQHRMPVQLVCCLQLGSGSLASSYLPSTLSAQGLS